MKRHSFRFAAAALLLICAAAFAAGLAIRAEPVWGMALAFLLFLLMMLPVLALRERRLRRYESSPALMRWTYSQRESDRVAGEILCSYRRRNRWVAPLIGACLLLIGFVFVGVLGVQFPQTPMRRLLPLLLIAALPWLVRWLYGLYLRDVITKEPCVTIVGRDFLVWGNTFPVFNEREKLSLADASFEEGEGEAHVRVFYKSEQRMRYGGPVRFYDEVRLLVPVGERYAALAFVRTVRSYGGNGGRSHGQA